MYVLSGIPKNVLTYQFGKKLKSVGCQRTTMALPTRVVFAPVTSRLTSSPRQRIFIPVRVTAPLLHSSPWQHRDSIVGFLTIALCARMDFDFQMAGRLQGTPQSPVLMGDWVSFLQMSKYYKMINSIQRGGGVVPLTHMCTENG